MLAAEERPRWRARLIELLWRVREESGGWNDRVFPRSENYGTAMSILSIMQPDMPLPARWRETIDGGAKRR